MVVLKSQPVSLGKDPISMVSTGDVVTIACNRDDATTLYCLLDLVGLTSTFSRYDLKEILYPGVTLKLFV